MAIVLLAGLVAVVLNLVLPQEDELPEENYAERILDSTGTGLIPKKERSDV
jgi:xanthine/uracil permease